MQWEGLSILQACSLTQVSRAGLYRRYQEQEPLPADIELRDAIQQVAVGHRSYGYRRVRKQLQDQGWLVNPPCTLHKITSRD